MASPTNPRVALRQVLREEDERLRAETPCGDCGKPTIGVQFSTGGHATETRTEAGLCVCPATLARIHAQQMEVISCQP